MVSYREVRPAAIEDDDLRPAEGVVFGILVSTLIWIALLCA